MAHEIWVGGLSPTVDTKDFCEFLRDLGLEPTKVYQVCAISQHVCECEMCTGGSSATSTPFFLFLDLLRTGPCMESTSPKKCSLPAQGTLSSNASAVRHMFLWLQTLFFDRDTGRRERSRSPVSSDASASSASANASASSPASASLASATLPQRETERQRYAASSASANASASSPASASLASATRDRETERQRYRERQSKRETQRDSTPPPPPPGTPEAAGCVDNILAYMGIAALGLGGQDFKKRKKIFTLWKSTGMCYHLVLI